MTNIEREHKLAVAKEKLKWLLSEEKRQWKQAELTEVINLVTNVKRDILLEINHESRSKKEVDRSSQER